jgi:outer membrane lipase/esterase
LGKGTWSHGPFAKVDFNKVTVKAFAEQGTSSTAMAFSKQRRTQLLGALGYQVQGNLGNVSPFARVSYEYDFEAKPSVVRASTVSMSGSQFTLPGATPNEKQVLVEAGVNARLGRAEVGLSVQGGFGRDQGDYFAGNLGVRVPF